MDKSVLLQKQVRDNSDELRSYLQDLKIWEDDMKRKESELTKDDAEPEVPIVRNKAKKTDEIKGKGGKTKARINSYDYAAWDKFNVDEECEKVDSIKPETDEPVKSDDEDPSQEYQTRLRDESIFEKERGNQFVRNKKWDEAISCYTHAIACYPKDPIFFANRALCFLKKNDLHSAEADCTSALQLDPTYVKALQRRAAAREGLKQLNEAVEDLKRVLELEPHNNESKKELAKIEKRLGVNKQESVPVKSASIEKIRESKSELLLTPRASTSKQIEPVQQKKPQSIEKQIPWPSRTSTQLIEPILKLPHQRSKKPLHRIEIIESDTSEIKINNIQAKQKVDRAVENNSLVVDYNESDALAKILAQSSQLDVDELLKDIESEAKVEPKITEPKKELKINTTLDKSVTNENENTQDFNFPVPKTSVQFYSNWKVMKNNNEQKFLYLKKINPIDLPNIFKESLESDIFSDIIIILSEYFTKNNVSVYEYIKYLSHVKRFSALTMFMSQNDKTALKKIFAYCDQNKDESAKDDINSLKKKYEM